MSTERPGDPEADQAPVTLPQLPALHESRQSYTDRLSRYLRLGLSFPERSARALSALIGGSTMLLSQTLLPTALQSTSSYRFTLGMFQAFLIRNIAGVEAEHSDQELKERFVQRKMLGTSLETAGLLTMHLSPVWVFAIASDTARGGQVFLNRLVHYLKENAVISEDANPESLEQVLQAVHDMGRQGATAIDTPPLSREEIKQLADELRATTSRLAEHSNNLMPRFEALWSQINLVARKQGLSVSEVLGILSVHAATATQLSAGTVGAMGKTGYHFLDEIILTDYKNTLAGISEAGALTYIRQHMAPFMNNAAMHFDFSRETATERWLKRSFGRLLAKLKSGQ
ncbi:MAG: hypothetical protein MRY76_11070 [Pseudomonadales bacterium]|nr:hypothetical protein [Pseudomonadales bacterium]